MKRYFFILILLLSVTASAQVGQHRNDFSIGLNGGYTFSSVRFTPSVPQGFHTGPTAGLSFRYVCEKYFKTICSIYGEVNFNSIGWKQDILDADDHAVINTVTGLPEHYSRTIKYIQVPIMAHLAWGREQKGWNFFFHGGPQFGFYQSESTSVNYDYEQRNIDARSNKVIEQETLPVDRKFDYGIVAGIGVEYSLPRFGHLLVEGRYYYGLGNIYPDASTDTFGSSNFQNIQLKVSYLFDIFKTKQ